MAPDDIGPCPVSDWDENEAFREIEEKIQDDLDNNKAVRAFLTSGHSDHKIVTFSFGDDTVELKIHPVVPFGLRAKMITLQQTMYQMEHTDDEVLRAREVMKDPVEAQRPMYEIIAMMCIDEPFNSWETWAIIDRRSGRGPLVMQKILETIRDEGEKVERFRSKR